jgi:hypothetical protein
MMKNPLRESDDYKGLPPSRRKFFLSPIFTAFESQEKFHLMPNVIKGVYRFTENETHFGECGKAGEKEIA